MMSYTRILWTVTVFMSACTAVWAQYSAQVKFLSYNLWGYHNAVTPGGYDSLAARSGGLK